MLVTVAHKESTAHTVIVFVPAARFFTGILNSPVEVTVCSVPLFNLYLTAATPLPFVSANAPLRFTVVLLNHLFVKLVDSVVSIFTEDFVGFFLSTTTVTGSE